MAMIAAFLAFTIAHNDQPGGIHWTGSQAMTVRTFEVLVMVFIFGAVAVAGGSLQVSRGPPSWLALAALVGLLLVMCFRGCEAVQLGG
jgi:hypothetical protein